MPTGINKHKAAVIANNYCVQANYDKTQGLILSGYSPSYARSARGHLIYEDIIVKQCIDHIQSQKMAITGYTIDQYLHELNAAIAHARALNQPSAEISGIIAKGRSQGFDKDNDMATDRQEELSEAQKQAAIEIAALSNRNKLKAV